MLPIKPTMGTEQQYGLIGQWRNRLHAQSAWLNQGHLLDRVQLLLRKVVQILTLLRGQQLGFGQYLEQPQGDKLR